MQRWLGTMRSLGGVALALFATGVAAADVAVLSTSAVRPALEGLLANWSHETGHRVSVRYGTAEEVRRKLASGERADLVLIPRADFEDAERQGVFHPAARRDLTVGRAGKPVAYSAGVRKGGPSAGVAGMLLEHLAGPEGRAAFAAP